jgi:SRSO17 transposase
MTSPGGWGVLDQAAAAGGARPVVAADADYGDNTTFRLNLGQQGWQYVVAVKGTTSAHAGDARPVTPQRRGRPGPTAQARSQRARSSRGTNGTQSRHE